MTAIPNPVLKGFNPDPSIVRVGDDYYVATSTFEWYPGVQVSHSRDLANWRVVARPLSRYSQLDLRGRPNSGGVWAPALSHADGLFHLIYTDVRGWAGSFKDVRNFLVTAPAIEGPWSEPVHLNNSGFDPSLFHDEDGRKWLVNMVWDHRPGHDPFGGILLQEYDPAAQRLVGPVHEIFRGSPLGLVEGPHLYKVDGWYYLLVAEGGTFATHAATVARSRRIEGPYEVMPGNPLLTSAHDPSLRLQSAGHGSLVQHRDGSWNLAHLCRRPLRNGRSILGRETALQAIVWEDGWPRLAHGGRAPADAFHPPALPPHPWPQAPAREDFDAPALPLHWQAPRAAMDDAMLSLSARPGFLRLYGRESIVSNFEQSLVARRQQAFHVEASTCVEFSPRTFQQMAGLVAFYSTDSFYYLFLTRAPHSARCLGLMRCERGQISYPVEKEYPLDDCERVHLKLEIDRDRIRFFHSRDGETWTAVAWEQDASILADEHAMPCGFTGNFVGIACQDLAGTRHHADFDWFEYRELD
ncbi:MAG TPA: glycoside hydrolase family 43 protein [Pseudoxanthomonas sp.]|nr:glycoside hydrolase family 43 protein [Pseudoxanthomonas sp.]